MRLTLASALLPAFLLFNFLSTSAQKEGDSQSQPPYRPVTAHTMLWRIQGKGLRKPSYLFGTMHVTNRSAFYFGDSLYAALEGVDGFAMEVHPDSLVAMLLRHESQKIHTKLLKDYLSKAEMSRIDAKSKKILGISADHLTKRDAFILKEKLSYRDGGNDDMPTFMDAYLYGIARDRSKTVAGLERPEDQELFLDDEVEKFDPKSLAEDDEKSQAFAQNFLKVYKDQNLPLLDSIFRFSSDSLTLAGMDRRNRVMVRSMDTLFRGGTYFVAVGAAHLSGDDGVIQLLRDNGYSVEPVMSSRKVEPGTYSFSKENGSQTASKTWVKVSVPEEGYAISIPGNPQDLPIMAGMKLKIYVDLAANTFFEAGSGPVLMQVTDHNRDSLFTEIINATTEKLHATVTRREKVFLNSLPGLDVDMVNTESGLVVSSRYFLSDKRVYVLAMGSEKSSTILPEDKNRFFRSFSMFAPKEVDGPHIVVDSAFYCSFLCPGKDNLEPVPLKDSGSRIIMHVISNPVTGNFFAMGLASARPGYALDEDSTFLNDLLVNAKGGWEKAELRSADTTVFGFRGLSVSGSIANGIRLRGLFVKRENYYYEMIGFGQSDSALLPELQQFYSSFRVIPFGEVPWSVKAVRNGGCIVYVPSKELRRDSDDSSYISVWVDSVRMQAFTISYSLLNPFSFASSDTAYLKSMFRKMHKNNETGDYTFTSLNGSPCLSYRICKANSGNILLGRMFLRGNRLFEQKASVIPLLESDSRVKAYFDSLQFTGQASSDSLNARVATEQHIPVIGPQRFLDALYSADTVTRAAAAAYLDSANFEVNDLQLILATLGRRFPEDSVQYWDIHYGLQQACRKLVTENALPVLSEKYHEFLHDASGYQYFILELVAGIKTTAAEDTLISLLSWKLPDSGNPYAFIGKLKDTLALARDVCPRLLPFQADSLLGLQLFYLYNRLLDSDMISFSMFRQYERDFLSSAYQYARQHRVKNDFDGDFDNMTDFLKRFRDTAMKKFFERGTSIPNVVDKFSSACALLYMGYTPGAPVIQFLAADPYERHSFYDSLSRYHKNSLFPKSFLTQKAFAESDLDVKMNRDDEDNDEHIDLVNFTFIKEGIYMYKGKKTKFLLFSARFRGEDSSFLGVAGPYAPGSIRLAVDHDASVTGVYYKERFQQKDADTQARVFLKNLSADPTNSEDEDGSGNGDN